MKSRREFLRSGAQYASLPLIVGNPGNALLGATLGTGLAGSVFSAAAQTGATPGSTIVLDDSASGVSRDYYHYTLKIAWKGSFAGGILGSTTVRGAGPFRITLAGGAPPHLVLTRTGSWVNVKSRESGSGPRLEVTYTDGTKDTLECLADATIDPSASAPQGADTRLIVGTAVLSFRASTKPVGSAQLVGEVLSAGGSAALTAYTFVSPMLPESPITYGLRKRGLSGPTVIHATDFSKPLWWYPWYTQVSAKPVAAQLPMVDTDLDTKVPLGRTAFCVQLAGAGQTVPALAQPLPESAAFMFPANIGHELEEVYFQYRLRFGEGWRGGSTQSGKLPGIASDTTVAGNGGGTSNGTNGWSFRGLFVGEPLSPTSPYNSNRGVVPIGWYTYNPDQVKEKQLYGLHVPWTGRGSLGLLEVGKDYWIDQYVKVNTPGRADGIVRAWINGRLAYERTDHVMRGFAPYQVPGNLGIQKIWMTFLHGGDVNPLPTKTLRTYWSDWTIASEYIGPPDLAGITQLSVTITSPAPAATFQSGSSVGVVAQASNAGGAVAKVEFYRNGVLSGSRTVAPYSATLSGVPDGMHILTAVAYDASGATVSSAPVTVTMGAVTSPTNRAPTVSITLPLTGVTLTQGADIAAQVSASDADGNLASVVIRLDGKAVATFGAGPGPFRTTLKNVAAGSHALTATATDSQGASATSALVTLTVVAPSTSATTLTLQTGSNGYTGSRSLYLSSWYKTENFAGKGVLLDGAAYASLLRFAVFVREGGPVPDGARIISAHLSLFKTSLYNFTYAVHRMLADWDEAAATWNVAAAGRAWSRAGAAGAGTDFASTADATASSGFTPGWLTFDVTPSLAAFAAGQRNLGWRLVGIAGNGNEKQFASRLNTDPTLRPKLVIAYS